MTCTYDNRNRETLCDWSDGTPDVTKGYDAVGRITSINNANSELTYTYDDAGQLLSEAQKVMALAQTKTVAYAYSPDGLRSRLTYPDGKELTYTYTARGQMRDVNFTYLTNPLARYSYDLAGRRTSRELTNSTETEYGYDNAGRLIELEQINSVGTFDQRQYGYNAVDGRIWEKRMDGLGNAYAYDSAQQVTGVQYGVTSPEGTPASPLRTVSYTYDPAGNRTQVTDGGSSVSYSANNLNQYDNVSGAVPTYDANGNLTGFGSQTYGFDGQNRLVSATMGSNTMNVLYDGRNRAVGRQVGGTWTYYAYDDWGVVAEYDDAGGLLATTAHGPSVDEYIFRWDASYNLTYYHQDVLGNVTALTDTTGLVVEKYAYDIYGAPVIHAPVGGLRANSMFGNPYLFTGRVWVAGIGLYDYRNRYYSPEIGRWLSRDPIGEKGGINLYRYVDNSPVNFSDPTGLEKLKIPGISLPTGDDGFPSSAYHTLSECQSASSGNDECLVICEYVASNGTGLNVLHCIKTCVDAYNKGCDKKDCN